MFLKLITDLTVRLSTLVSSCLRSPVGRVSPYGLRQCTKDSSRDEPWAREEGAVLACFASLLRCRCVMNTLG
jgi:hypothetical protein